MAEIVFDDNKLCIPNRLRVSTFLSELQKKTKQIIYLINDKEVGIFQSLEEVKKGMWRRLKPNDDIAHYYIDPETQNEYTIFSNDCANKLGNFPYEGTTRVQSQTNPDRSMSYQQTIQSVASQPRQLHPSLQQPIVYQQQNPSGFQQIHPQFQQENQQFQQENPSLQYRPVGYQKYPEPQPTQMKNTQQRMNPKSIQNLNRILAFQRQQNNPPEPSVNQWFNNPESIPPPSSQVNHYNPYTPNQTFQNQQFSTNPQLSFGTGQQNPQLSFGLNQQTSHLGQPIPQNIQQTSQFGTTQQTPQLVRQMPMNYQQEYNPQTSSYPQNGQQRMNYQQNVPQKSFNYQPSSQTSIHYQQNVPNPENRQPTQETRPQPTYSQQNTYPRNMNYPSMINDNSIMSAQTVQSIQTDRNGQGRDPMKYFPPGTRKTQNQNVQPQIVETKFTA